MWQRRRSTCHPSPRPPRAPRRWRRADGTRWSCHRCRRRLVKPWKLQPCNPCMWRTTSGMKPGKVDVEGGFIFIYTWWISKQGVCDLKVMLVWLEELTFSSGTFGAMIPSLIDSIEWWRSNVSIYFNLDLQFGERWFFFDYVTLFTCVQTTDIGPFQRYFGFR